MNILSTKKLVIASSILLALLGCSKQAYSIDKKTIWTLVAQGDSGKSKWYLDFDSMNIKSPNVYSYKELYDSSEPFEAIRNDGRKVKSVIDEKLVNCTDGKIKGESFTAYVENMGKGMSFTSESKLQMWLGTVPDTPSRKIVIALCQHAPVVAEVKADPIVFESDSKLGLALGMLGKGDALLKKKLGTSVGKPIQITSMFVWSYDGSEWEKGGRLHLINDDSMGRAYRITCSISSENGDKFMETKKRRDIVASGILKDYSSSYGLTIDPCNATWKESDTPK